MWQRRQWQNIVSNSAGVGGREFLVLFGVTAVNSVLEVGQQKGGSQVDRGLSGYTQLEGSIQLCEVHVTWPSITKSSAMYRVFLFPA